MRSETPTFERLMSEGRPAIKPNRSGRAATDLEGAGATGMVTPRVRMAQRFGSGGAPATRPPGGGRARPGAGPGGRFKVPVVLICTVLCFALFVPSVSSAQSRYSEKAQAGFRAVFCSALASMHPDRAETTFQRVYWLEGDTILKSYFADLRNNRVGTIVAGPRIDVLDELTKDGPDDYKTQMVWLEAKKGILGRMTNDWWQVEPTGVERRGWTTKWVSGQMSKMGCIEDA